MRTIFHTPSFPGVIIILSLLLGCSSSPVHRGSDPVAEIRREPALWSPCGTSVEGRSIYQHLQGTGDSVILVLGSIHGDEEAGGGVVVRLAETIAAGHHVPASRRIVLVPVLNPDGVQRGTRWNAHGVDLNRNFPAGNWDNGMRGGIARHGDRPASEPETRLVMDLIARYKPVLIIAVHAPLRVVNYDGPAAEIAQEMGRRNGYPVSGSIGYPTPGSLGTYAGVERSIPIITLELPHCDGEEGWAQNRDALLSAVGSR